MSFHFDMDVTMHDLKTQLSVVVNDFIASLSGEKLGELENLILSHQLVESWPWYELIIDSYLKGPGGAALREEMEKLLPVDFVFKEIETSRDLPVLEAKIILREAQKILKK